MTPATAVVFDIGNVLIPWEPPLLYRRLFGGDEARMNRFFAEVVTNDWILENDAGRPVEQGVAELAARHPAHAPLIRAFHERWEEMLGPPIAANVALAEGLVDRGTPVFALSNWPPDKFHHARTRLPVLARFTGLVVSGDVKLRKPDPAIFRLLLSRHVLEASTTVFVDDSPEHVAAASALGLRAIRYRAGDDLRAGLAAAGVPA